MLGKYVREDGVLTLEDAVRKATSQAAIRVGITDRGLVRPGMFADLVVFDPATVKDLATFEQPTKYSAGMRDVLVNGRAVVRNGAITDERPGVHCVDPGTAPPVEDSAMFRRYLAAASLLAASACAAPEPPTMTYPTTRRVDHLDTYHGVTVSDPYRWLEDDTSAETAAWVEAQNRVTFAHLETIPFRGALTSRLEQLFNYPKFSAPERRGTTWFFSKNDGLQNQAVIYKASRALTAPPEVLLDPNTLSTDGTVAKLSGVELLARTAGYAAYSTSASGWLGLDGVDRVREVATGRASARTRHASGSKFSDAAWKKDGSGFYYSRYDAPMSKDEALQRGQQRRS